MTVLRLYGPRNRNGNNRAVWVELDDNGFADRLEQDHGRKPDWVGSYTAIEVPARELRQWLDMIRAREDTAARQRIAYTRWVADPRVDETPESNLLTVTVDDIPTTLTYDEIDDLRNA